MFTSFSTALSALSAHTTAIDIVGNNLANLNTNGYKTTGVSFHDLVTQSLGAGLGETQVGFGVGRPITLRQFSQGAIQTTSAPLDTAIQGDGFMVVKDANDNQLFTRGGSLQVSKSGKLSSSTGQRIQGWTMVNGTLNTNAPIGDITIPVGSLNAPVATKSLSVDLNLSAAAVNGQSSGSFSTSLQVYDSLGVPHTVTMNFTKTTTANSWDYTVTGTDGTVTTTPAAGNLTFKSDGTLQSPAPTDPMPKIAITGLPNGAADLDITWNLYDGTSNRLTQYNQPSATAANAQDGSPSAQLVRVGVGDGGTILAQYSNGQQTVVGQIAMAAIRNPESMLAVGDNNYQMSANSALPAIGVAGTGGRGQIIGGAVESSTVDIAKQFTDLIVFQRGFQANAKVITTADELSQDTINLKR